jgi:hypothetical protein
MAALLSSRTALAVRSSSLSTGGIVGVVVGVVIAVLLLIFVCILPFVLRARHRRRRAALGTDDGMLESPRSHGFLSNSPFGDTFRRFSHSAGACPTTKVSGGGSDTGDSAEKQEQSVYIPDVPVQYGLPTPAATPQDVATGPEPLPGRSIQDGRTATGSLTLGPESTRDSIAPKMLSRETTMMEGSERGAGLTKQSFSNSFVSPSRQGTFGSHGITEEPKSFAAQGGLSHQGSHSRKRSHHLSDSLRHLAHMASAALRRDSTMSNGSARGSLRSPIERPDVLTHAQTAPPILEPEFINTEAPGLAYDYYHPSPGDIPPAPEHSASYGPPLSIPDTFAEPSTLPGFFISPTSATTVTPITPVSPGRGPQAQLPWTDPRATSGQGGEAVDPRTASLRETKGGPRPLERTGTQPLHTFMSDLPSPPLPSTEQLAVDPRSVMRPTTKSEIDFEEKQELFKLTTPSPPAAEATREMSAFPSQPTPDLTPEPEPELEAQWNLESMGDSELPWPAPEIALDGGNVGDVDDGVYPDTVMADSETWAPSTTAGSPNHMTPYQTPHSLPTPDSRPQPQIDTPYLGTYSPQSVAGSSVQADDRRASGHTSSERTSQSPGQFACHECDRVFDQLHKLQ